MTRPAFTPTKVDPAVDKNFTILQQILSGQISYDNMGVRVISGTTSATPDSPGLAIHSMSPHPVGWFPLVGDVYVQKIDEKYIDVRSTKPSVNYKIILLAGNSVTTEAVVAVGGDDYRDTIEVIENPTGETEEETEGGGTQNAVLNYDTHVAQIAGGDYNSILKIGDYFYIGAQPDSVLYRVNVNTGVADSLALGGATGVSALYYDGASLWCADSLDATAVDTANVYQINLSAFTLTATAACALRNSGALSSTSTINDLYVDGSNIYLACTDRQLASRPGKIVKCNKTTGAFVAAIKFSAATWGTLSTAGTCRLIPSVDGASLYAITTDVTSVSKLRVGIITLSSFTMSEFTFPTDNLRRTTRSGVLCNGSLWFPVGPSVEISGSGVPLFGYYPYVLMEFNVTSHTFTEHPLAIGTRHSSQGLLNPYLRNCIEVDGFIYLVYSVTNSSPLLVIEYDTLTGDQGVFAAPIIPDNYIANNLTAINTMLVKDSNAEAGFVIVKQNSVGSTGNTSISNFEWFEPTFEEE